MKTVINIKADREVKIGAQKLAKDLGLSLSAIINAYLKQFIRNKAVGFSVASQMSPELEKLAGRVEYDIRHGRNLSPAMRTDAEINEYFARIK